MTSTAVETPASHNTAETQEGRDAPTSDAGRDGSRLARAATQLDGVLAERLRARLRAPGRATETAELIRAIAAHELDPYAAADRLLPPGVGSE